jgi:hypothetical protein
MNTDYLTKRLSAEARKPLLRVAAVISRFFCKRCQMHEYYDANFNSPALFLIPKRAKWWIIEKYRDYKRSKSNELPF